MPEFVPGIELARGFYEEVLAPALHGVAHSAARLGRGSDVLGLDDERSTDHGWGPRAQIFVRRSDARETEQRIEGALPDTYHGWPVRFGWDEVPVRHHVEVAPLGAWLEELACAGTGSRRRRRSSAAQPRSATCSEPASSRDGSSAS